jgi:hypothetical protein
VIGIDQLASHQHLTRQQPACGEGSPEVFVGRVDSLAGRPRYAWERRALGVCAGCPGARACLAEVMEHPAAEQHGVVGGMTAGQRQAVRRASASRAWPSAAIPQAPPHGFPPFSPFKEGPAKLKTRGLMTVRAGLVVVALRRSEMVPDAAAWVRGCLARLK